MEIPAIFIGLVILAAIAFYVSRPLVQSRRAAKSDGVDTLSLGTQRESLYTQIKELDLDHATGKVNEEDYVRLRADLVAQATVVLRQIDGAELPVAPQPAARPMLIATSAGADDLEAQIAARRKTRSTPAPQAADSDVEAAIAARRKIAAPAASELACPQCGKPITADDAFCAKCGTALKTQAAA
ncbi:MAG: zinc ribbon domain-containing protein [Chloroflexi bacterium]|nr:zinc ribbon domain-containing protein [Chloroflexota bacterium]